MRYRRRLLLVAALFIGACAGYGVIGGGECKKDSDCPPGNTCSNGQCTPTTPPDGGTGSCERDRDCPANQVCQDHMCVPETPPDGGTGCTSNDQCPSGTTCQNGSCQNPPNDGGNGGNDGGTGCHNDNDCPNGQECEDGVCRPDDDHDGGTGCHRDNDCPDDQICEDGVCGPHCHGDHGDGGSGGDGGNGGGSDGGSGGSDGGGVSCDDGPWTCKAGKALICHVPPGNPANEHSICVGLPAVPAHVAHGDHTGRCSCH